MGTRKISDVRRVSRKEVRELSKLPWLYEEALSDRSFEARVLFDGRVLHCFRIDGTAQLYPSRAAAEEMWREYEEMGRKTTEQLAKPTVDSCFTFLPPIADFLRDVEAHAKSLGKRLRIPDEALDGTVASLDAVDKALRRIPWAKRPVPDLLTPLVAYVGEVMRRVSGGHWTRSPTSRKRQVAVYDPTEEEAFQAALQAATPAAYAAAEKAGAEAKARRDSKADVASAIRAARSAVYDEVFGPGPKLLRIDVVDDPITGHENEPMITTRDGRLWQPFALVYVPMIEPSKRLPLRLAVETTLVSR